MFLELLLNLFHNFRNNYTSIVFLNNLAFKILRKLCRKRINKKSIEPKAHCLEKNLQPQSNFNNINVPTNYVPFKQYLNSWILTAI